MLQIREYMLLSLYELPSDVIYVKCVITYNSYWLKLILNLYLK